MESGGQRGVSPAGSPIGEAQHRLPAQVHDLRGMRQGYGDIIRFLPGMANVFAEQSAPVDIQADGCFTNKGRRFA